MRLQEDKDLFSENELAARGTIAKSGNRIMTANIVCNLALEADKYQAFEYQPHAKGNFGFIEDLFDSFQQFQLEEETNYQTAAKSERTLDYVKTVSSVAKKENSLYHSLMRTSIGV